MVVLVLDASLASSFPAWPVLGVSSLSKLQASFPSLLVPHHCNFLLKFLNLPTFPLMLVPEDATEALMTEREQSERDEVPPKLRPPHFLAPQVLVPSDLLNPGRLEGG